MLSIQRGGKSAKEGQGKSMKSAKQVTTQFVPPTHPAIIITSAFNAPHIQKLKEALQEHFIAFGMQTSKKKVNRPPGSPTDKNFIVVDDSLGPSLLEGQFLGLKMCRVDYPRGNNIKDVIKKFDKYIGLGKMNEEVNQQHEQENYAHRQSDQFNQKQLLRLQQQGKLKSNINIGSKNQLFQLQNLLQGKDLLEKLKSGRQKNNENENGNIRLKSIGKYGEKGQSINITKRILFILMTQKQSQRYSQYLQRLGLGEIKNKRIIPIKSLAQYYRYAYQEGEGENCLLLGPNIASKELYKFRNLKNVYIYGEDPKFCAQLVKGNIRRVGMTPNEMDEILIQEGFDKNEPKEYDPPKNFGKQPELVGKGARRSYSQKKPQKDSLFKRFVRFIKGKEKDKEPPIKQEPKKNNKSSTSSSNKKKSKSKKSSNSSSSNTSRSSSSSSNSSNSRKAKSNQKIGEKKKKKTLKRLKNNQNPDQAMIKQPSGKTFSEKQLVSLGKFVDKQEDDAYGAKVPDSRSAKSRKIVKLKTYQGNPVNALNPNQQPQKTKTLVPSTNDLNLLKANKPPQGELQIDSYIGSKNSKPQIAFANTYKLGKQNDNNNKRLSQQKKIQFLIANPIFKNSPTAEQPEVEFIMPKDSDKPKDSKHNQDPEDQDLNDFSKRTYDPVKLQKNNGYIQGNITNKQSQKYQINFVPINLPKFEKPQQRNPYMPTQHVKPQSDDDDEYYSSQPKQPKPTKQQYVNKVGNINVNQDHDYFHQVKYIPQKNDIMGLSKKVYKNISGRPDFHIQNKQSQKWPLKELKNQQNSHKQQTNFNAPKILRNTIKNVRPAECNNQESDKSLNKSDLKVAEFASPNKVKQNVEIPLKSPQHKINETKSYPKQNPQIPYNNNANIIQQPASPMVYSATAPYSAFPLGNPAYTQSQPPHPLFVSNGFPALSPSNRAKPYIPNMTVPISMPHNFIAPPSTNNNPILNSPQPNTNFKLPFDENLYNKFIQNGIVVYRPKKNNLPLTLGSPTYSPLKPTMNRSVSPSYGEIGNGIPFRTTTSSNPIEVPMNNVQFAKPFYSSKPTKQTISSSSQPTVGKNPSFSTYQYFANKGDIQPNSASWPEKFINQNDKKNRRQQKINPYLVSQSSQNSSTPKRKSYQKYNYSKKLPKHNQSRHHNKSNKNRNSYQQDYKNAHHNEYFNEYLKDKNMTKTREAFYDRLDSDINTQRSNPKRHRSSKSKSKGKGKLRDPLSSILDANSPKKAPNLQKNYSVLYLIHTSLPPHIIKQLFQVCQSTDTIQTYSHPTKMQQIIQKGKTVFDFVIVFDQNRNPHEFQSNGQTKGLYSVSYQPNSPQSLVNNKIIVLRKTDDLQKILTQIWFRNTLNKPNARSLQKNRKIGHIYYKDFNRPIRDMAKILKNYYPQVQMRKYFSLEDLPTKMPNINNSITIILLDQVSFTEVSQYCANQQIQNPNLLKICIPKSLQSMKICKNQPGTQKMIWLTQNQLKDQDFLVKRINKRIFN